MENTPLLDLMSAQIAGQREALLLAARDEAAQIQENARVRAEQRRSETLSAAKGELASIARRSRERTEAEAQMVTLTMKDTITNEVLAEVTQELARIAAGPGFPEILDLLLAELMAEAPSDVVVLAPPAHAGHCKQWLESHGHGHLAVEPARSLTDGVAIQDPAKKFRFTNTLTTRFKMREGALRKASLNRLFPAASRGGEG